MDITPKIIASLINGRVEGDENIEITGFAKIEEAKKGEITFIANPKYGHYLSTTEASAVLVSDEFEPEGDFKTTLIRVSDPYFALAELLKAFCQKTDNLCGIEEPSHIAEGINLDSSVYIGAFSYIGKNAVIGKNVKIYPQCFIGNGVKIGDDTVVRAGVKIYENCEIGARCIIHSGAVIGADGFGFAPTEKGYDKIAQIGIVKIEDDVEIGANTTIDRATFGQTLVKRGTKLDNLIQVAHNVEIGEDNVFAAQTGIAGSTKIGDRNRIGGQVGFAGHIKIGNDNEIGAQTGIPRNVGNGQRLIGYPAVDIRTFARNAVLLKNLDSIIKELKNNNR